MNQTPGIHAYEKPVENDFEYVYTENKDKSFRKVTKAMLKVLLGVATKLSELENDKNFIDNTVADLKNYYLKTETYSKGELDDKLSLIPRFSVQVVSSLPTENISDTTVYLVPSDEDEYNLYTEYINVNGLWEILGTQKVPKVEVTKESIESALGYTPADDAELRQLSDTVNAHEKTVGLLSLPPVMEDMNGKRYVYKAVYESDGAVTLKSYFLEELPDFVENEEFEKLEDTVNNMNGGTIVTDMIDYDLNVKAVNHRGYSTEAPENTIPAYILSKQKGFKYVECDVSFTSDGVAVLLHDATIDRTSNGTGNINEMTYADVLTYDFGSWKDSKYEGTKIPTFEEFIKLCKHIGLHPYIELKSNGSYTQEQITKVVNIIKSCGMQGKVTYISFTRTFLEYVKNADSKARLGYLQSYDVNSGHITSAQGLQTGENEVFLDTQLNYLTESGVELCKNADLPLEVWTVNDEKKILAMNPYITGVTSDNLIAGKVLYDNYMVYTEPEVILLSITATYTGGSVNVGTNVTDLGGIVVTANYSDGSTANVTDYTISGNISVGTNTVTITYKNKTTTITVIGIAEDEEEITLSSINATYTGGEVTEGTPLTLLTGVSVVGTYSDGSISTITGYTLSGNIVVGENTITVSYGTLTTTFTVIGIVKPQEEIGTLLYNWDFTKSMTDTVSGITAVTNATQDSNGVTFDVGAKYIELIPNEITDMSNKIVEIDVSCPNLIVGSQHGRVFSVSNNNGNNHYLNTGACGDCMIWRHSSNDNGWTYYVGSWNYNTILSDADYPINFFDGKTIRLSYDENENPSLSYANIGSRDLTPLAQWSHTRYKSGHLIIGGNTNNDLYEITFKAVRIYSVA